MGYAVRAETDAAISLVKELLRQGIPAADIGVACLYTEQVTEILRTAGGLGTVSVKTVDGSKDGSGQS